MIGVKVGLHNIDLLSLERLAVIVEINADLRRKNTYISILELQVVSGAVSLLIFR